MTEIKQERETSCSQPARDSASAQIVEFRHPNGKRYLGGPLYADFVLRSDLVLPPAKVEALMLEALKSDCACEDCAEPPLQISE